jgi:predicted transcriptional regulator of viral defense system
MMNVGLKPTEVIVVARTAVGIPPRLARLGKAVFRPRDLADIYAHPRAEVARLAANGVVRQLATGYYTLVPAHRIADRAWRPDPQASALGVGQADYGMAAVALMGVSAARVHGAIPRSLAVAVVAVPKQRPEMEIDGARVVFARRDTQKLDLERTETELGTGWVTTVEQTLLDLAVRPKLGGISKADADEAMRALAIRADWATVETLAQKQHRPGALRVALEGRHA